MYSRFLPKDKFVYESLAGGEFYLRFGVRESLLY
jgi:hypothetical protein